MLIKSELYVPKIEYLGLLLSIRKWPTLMKREPLFYLVNAKKFLSFRLSRCIMFYATHDVMSYLLE